jgi:hypothetical protein
MESLNRREILASAAAEVTPSAANKLLISSIDFELTLWAAELRLQS